MTNAGDHPEQLKADLRQWILQNKDQGLDWFLDEGPVAMPDGGQVTESVSESVSEQVAEPVTKAKAKAKAELKPESKPTIASRSISSPPPRPAPAIADPTFKKQCDYFVNEARRVISAQPAFVSGGDVLLNQFDGNPNKALTALRDEILPCQACGLAKSRIQVVFGSGSAEASVVFVGEVPGREEDQQGVPFSGESAQLLSKITEAIGFDRNHVFNCNVLKCRPPESRDPLNDEVDACLKVFKRQMAIIQPRIICCLGKVAAKALLGSGLNFTNLSLNDLRAGVYFYEGIAVMVTHHPTALLRNPSWKRDTWNDVQRLRALYDALESES